MIAPNNSRKVTDMGRLRTILIYAAGALAPGIAIGNIEYPDSLFVCLSAVAAVHIISSMFGMCDRLLDPPPAIFMFISGHRIVARHFLDFALEQSEHSHCGSVQTSNKEETTQ